MNYIYALCHPDKTPFYVGVTADVIKRYKSHLAEARGGAVSLKNQAILEILAIGEYPFFIQLAHADDRDEAFKIEAKYIEAFPNLTNVQCPHLIWPFRKKERVYLLHCDECHIEWEVPRLGLDRRPRCRERHTSVRIRAKWLYDPLMKRVVNYEDLERDRKALGLIF